MPILKHKKNSGFVQISNALAQNKNLSYEALGLLVNLLSRPDDWVVHKSLFINSKCGKGTLTRIFKELQVAGYLKMLHPRDEKGRISNVWLVSDEVMKEDENSEILAENPNSGDADVRANRLPDNEHLQINNITNKEKDKKKESSMSVCTDDEDTEVNKICKKNNQINYEAIKDLYNTICAHNSSRLPTCKILTKNRAKAISARFKDGSLKTLEDWEKYFKLVAASKFLMGHNDTNWTATFDWLLNPTNVVKVLEFTYDNLRR